MLDVCEYDALVRVWEDSRTFHTALVAALRADLHNTSARDFGQHFEPKDFMPGANAAIEDRVAELVARGMNPAAAVAVATSKQPKEQQIHLVNSIQPKAPGKGNRARRS